MPKKYAPVVTVPARKRRVVRGKPRKRPSFNKAVKNAIYKIAETKYSGTDPAGYAFNATNALMSAPVNLSDAFNLSQGTNQGERVGNRIDITRAMLNLNITQAGGSAAGPNIVTIFIGYLKGTRGTAPSSTSFLSLLQDGNLASGMDNTTLSLLRNINTDLFVAKRYTFKVGQSFWDPGTGIQVQGNNDFKMFVNRKISLKPLLGNMTFQTDSTASSHNKDLFMWCQWTVPLGTVDSVPPILNYFLDGGYKDI